MKRDGRTCTTTTTRKSEPTRTPAPCHRLHEPHWVWFRHSWACLCGLSGPMVGVSRPLSGGGSPRLRGAAGGVAPSTAWQCCHVRGSLNFGVPPSWSLMKRVARSPFTPMITGTPHGLCQDHRRRPTDISNLTTRPHQRHRTDTALCPRIPPASLSTRCLRPSRTLDHRIPLRHEVPHTFCIVGTLSAVAVPAPGSSMCDGVSAQADCGVGV